jgi:hypothetical protein
VQSGPRKGRCKVGQGSCSASHSNRQFSAGALSAPYGARQERHLKVKRTRQTPAENRDLTRGPRGCGRATSRREIQILRAQCGSGIRARWCGAHRMAECAQGGTVRTRCRDTGHNVGNSVGLGDGLGVGGVVGSQVSQRKAAVLLHARLFGVGPHGPDQCRDASLLLD